MAKVGQVKSAGKWKQEMQEMDHGCRQQGEFAASAPSPGSTGTEQSLSDLLPAHTGFRAATSLIARQKDRSTARKYAKNAQCHRLPGKYKNGLNCLLTRQKHNSSEGGQRKENSCTLLAKVRL